MTDIQEVGPNVQVPFFVMTEAGFPWGLRCASCHRLITDGRAGEAQVDLTPDSIALAYSLRDIPLLLAALDEAQQEAKLHEHGYCEHSIAHNERLSQRIGVEVARAEAAEARAAAADRVIEQVRARIAGLADTIHGDDGWEHNAGCEGEPTSYACILDTLRSLLGGGEAR